MIVVVPSDTGVTIPEGSTFATPGSALAVAEAGESLALRAGNVMYPSASTFNTPGANCLPVATTLESLYFRVPGCR